MWCVLKYGVFRQCVLSRRLLVFKFLQIIWLLIIGLSKILTWVQRSNAFSVCCVYFSSSKVFFANQEQTPYALTMYIRLKAWCLKYLVHGVCNIVLAVKTEMKLVDANMWSFAVDKTMAGCCSWFVRNCGL